VWLYWTCTLTMCAMRLAAFFKKLDNHVRRVQEGGQRKTPIGLATHAYAVIMYFILAITLGTNAANVDNGISFSLYSLGYISFIVNYSVLLVRTVRLGQRLIPKAFLHRTELNFLSKFNKPGMFLIIIQSIAAFISCIALGVVCPLLPSDDIVLGVVGFSTKGTFQMLCILGIVLQFERCIRALDIFRVQVASSPTIATDHELQLTRTIRIMRQRQWTILLLGGGVSIIYIIFAAQAVPWTWVWVFLGTAGFETLGSLVIEFCFASGSRTKNGTGDNTSGSKMSPYRSRGSKEDTPQGGTPGTTAPVAPQLPVATLSESLLPPAAQEDVLKDLPTIKVSGIKGTEREMLSVARRAFKRGPMGYRLKRKHKLEIDLTKVTEEQSYFSSMNPMASSAVQRTSQSFQDKASSMHSTQ
jgi:hypothetical protein